MRLINADELKKCAIPCEIHNGALTELCVPLYQIENAPTVVEDYDTGYQDGLEDGLNDIRPQGKWEVDKHGEHFCPKCGHYALYEEDQEND